MESVNRIITAKDFARRERAASVTERIKKMAKDISARGGIQVHINGTETRGFAVFAEIDFGRWIARCECGGAEMVDPDEPVFFDFSCANRENNHALRPVIFPEPEERAEIERLVLERPVDDRRGLDDLERAYLAKPILFAQKKVGKGAAGTITVPLSRSWAPGESVDDLREQNKAVDAWRKDLAKEEHK